VRFIEYMPLAADPDWRSSYVSGNEMLQKIQAEFALEPVDASDPAAPARYYRVLGSAARVGIITPVSHDFCNRCNRIRVTATGLAKGCLFSTSSTDLKPLLRAGDEVLRGALRAIVAHKEPRHRLLASQPVFPIVAMAQIGG
jgi:GTP 3',8-cyclase